MFPFKDIYGHAFITNSNPPSSQSLATPPSQVEVYFSEPIDIKYSVIKILDENGKQVDTENIHYLNSDQTSITIGLPKLKDGIYTVTLKVLSQTDGHVTDSSIVFAIGQKIIPPEISHNISQKSVIYIPEALARIPALIGQVIIVGGSFSTLWLWRPLNRIENFSTSINELRKKIDKRLLSVFLFGSALLIVSDIAILIFQSQAISAGIGDVISTRFGTIILIRTILSIVVFLISLYIFQNNKKIPRIIKLRETIPILSIGILLLATTSLIGHGAANYEFASIIIDFVHNLAASIWIGGVLYLGFVLTSELRLDKILKHEHKIAWISLLIPRFSILVITILGFIVFTGPFLLYILDNNLSQVFSSLYGLTLVIKLSLATVMLGIGSYNQLTIQKNAKAFTLMTINSLENNKFKDMKKISDAGFSLNGNKKLSKKTNKVDILSRFSRSTKIESIIGVLLLTSVAFMVNTGLPKSESSYQSQIQSDNLNLVQGFKQGYQSTYFVDNSTRVVLSIVPYMVGINNFTVSFVDANNNPVETTAAMLQYTEVEKSIGPNKISLNKVSNDIYSAQGTFGIPGLWNIQVEGIQNKSNSPSISATFNDVRLKPRLEQLYFNTTEFNTKDNSSMPLYPLYDKNRNLIWVGDTKINSGQILEYDIDKNQYYQHKINKTNIITILTLDSKNNLWFIDPISKQFGIYRPDNNQYQLFQLPKKVSPTSLAIDPNDHVWISSSTTGQILVFDTKTNNFTKDIQLEKGARPLTILIDPFEGTGWVADERGKITMIDSTNNYSLTNYEPSGMNSTLKSPTALLLDKRSNNILISQHEGQKVSVFNLITRTFHDYPQLDPEGLPFGMAMDKYGNVWVAQHTINKISVIDPETGNSKEVNIPNKTPFVQWLTSDADGNIWFAEQRGNALGMISSNLHATPINSVISQSFSTEDMEKNSWFNYNLVVAPAIIAGLVLVALMYVKSIIDYRIAEKNIKKYLGVI